MADTNLIGLVRACLRCNEAKPATTEYFAPHKQGKYGLTSRCRECERARAAEMRSRPEQKARQKAWRDANRDKVRETNRAYRASGYKSTEAVAKWRKENLSHARERDAAAMRHRRATDPSFALLCRMRGRMRHMAKGKAGRRTVELLGYTIEDLRKHLERQFLRGMTWENMADWEIDHIIPVAAFNISSVDDPDFKHCWALTNLRPLWTSENRAKNAKVLTLL